MAPKRKYQEPERQEAVHESRQFQVYGSVPKAAKKPRRSEPPVHKKQVHTSSVNAIKKRIRDVKRRMERTEELPANVRIEDERALNAYQQELAEAEAEKLRQKMIKRYHMVRFFERQKATRQLKKLRKHLLVAEASDIQRLKDQMHIAEVDLNYTQYCPLTEAYISLYPQKTGEHDGTGPQEEARPKPQMWAEVEKCMEQGTLNQLRNRSANAPATLPRKVEVKPTKPKPRPQPAEVVGMNRRQRRSQGRVKEAKKPKNKSTGFEKNEAFGVLEGVKHKATRETNEAEESDGGFFEEL